MEVRPRPRHVRGVAQSFPQLPQLGNLRPPGLRLWEYAK